MIIFKIGLKIENQIAAIVVDCAFKVHVQLGAGLLESAYHICLLYELRERGLMAESEHPMPVIYDGIKLDCGYRVDIWVDRKVVIELKAVQALTDVHMAQIISYLKLSDNRLGLLINFNVARIKDGIKRVANGM